MLVRFSACVAAGVVAVSSARADVSFGFAWGEPAKVVQPGESFSVPLFLTETVTGDSVSLWQSENGLSSIGVAIARQSLPAAASPAVLQASGLQANFTDFFDSSDPIFGPEISVSGGLARVLLFARDAGVGKSSESATIRSVQIASVSFTAGSVGGETTVFIAGDFDAGSLDTVTWTNFLVIDQSITPATLTINTIVPSPGAFAVLVAAVHPLRRRRR